MQCVSITLISPGRFSARLRSFLDTIEVEMICDYNQCMRKIKHPCKIVLNDQISPPDVLWALWFPDTNEINMFIVLKKKHLTKFQGDMSLQKQCLTYSG